MYTAVVASVAMTARDDGYLTASETAALKLDADWIVLSACNTAAGSTEGAEALSGIAGAFFYAGARALLVSHWAVDSDATVNATQGLLLRRVRALVQVERQLPIAILHVAGGVDEQGHIETIETHAIALTGVHMPTYKGGAVAVGGRREKDARTRSFAIAGLEVGALYLPAHSDLLRSDRPTVASCRFHRWR